MYIQANFSKRQLVLEVGIDTQYLMATLNDVRRVEGKVDLSQVWWMFPYVCLTFFLFFVMIWYTAQIFEKGKEELGGVHFLALQKDPESEEVDGFFLLRERKR